MHPYRIWMTFLRSEKIFTKGLQEQEDELQQVKPVSVKGGDSRCS
jgi:hypothetical protein